jgi:Protein of unknown function (DUF4235)
MTSEGQSPVLTKALYRPVGWVCSVVPGVLAGVVFKRLWRRTTHGDHDKAPSALQSEYGMREILLAATLQGAIAGGVKALIDRNGARAFQHWTGEWPGD